eukprot:TRINITY_DN17575_c0_g1_i1.p1 TRINITY_DN17575_c0_g1~~TRINITY_DN17575_c0_g1_i1.p1  ORF type:complete len:383 (-),score=64.87 TRINITY_DN17575_c0_g1_i1:388-1536(-)
MDAAMKLPAAEFTYIGRPAESFEGRWAAIAKELDDRFGIGGEGKAFSLVDVGSNHGYFCLNAGLRYPAAQVVGIEGAVGVGNGTIGTVTREPMRLAATSAARVHLQWVKRLGLQNVFLAPEVWDLDSILDLRQRGLRVNVMLHLSVIHHIDGICRSCYSKRKLGQVDGSLELIAQLLSLADIHVVELPDAPWLDHLHDAFGNYEGILKAAVARSDEAWTLKKMYSNDWLGTRELWLVERTANAPSTLNPRTQPIDFASFFKVLLTGTDLDSLPPAEPEDSKRETAKTVKLEDVSTLPGDATFVAEFLSGSWENSYGASIEIEGVASPLSCRYSTGRIAELYWLDGRWHLSAEAGDFVLTAAATRQLYWQERNKGWSTIWSRS